MLAYGQGTSKGEALVCRAMRGRGGRYGKEANIVARILVRLF
jgi:hypothetical protein